MWCGNQLATFYKSAALSMRYHISVELKLHIAFEKKHTKQHKILDSPCLATPNFLICPLQFYELQDSHYVHH